MKKRIVITGATSGIGLETARQLYRDGHELFLVGRDAVKIEKLKEEFRERTTILQSDVTDYLQVKQMADGAAQKMGGIDVLVNNAGLGFFEKIVDGRIDQWHTMVDVNVKGVLNCIHACLPHLLASSGLLVQVASVAAHHVFPNSGVYCATKHAVAAISESLRIELQGKLKVSTISPGAVNTNFINTTTDEAMLKEYRDYFASSMKPEDIANQIRYCVNAPDNIVISEIIVRPNRKNR